jgi:TolA-binding protein
MFASGDQYAADFSQVSAILDKTTGALENQKSTAENQLSALEDSVSFLNLIETNTETTTQLLAQLVALAPVTEAARKAAAESGSIAAGGTGFTPPVIIGLKDVVAAVTASTTAATTAATTSSDKLIKCFELSDISTTTAIKTASDKEVTISTLIANYDLLTNTILNQLVEITSANRTIAVTVNPVIEFNPTINVAAPSVTVNNKGGGILGGILGGIGGGIVGAVGDIFGWAEGGLAPAGINLVGEKGPELVDFKTPGRVYSNKASNDLFNSKQLVEEIRSLRQEVNRLRNDQKEQTGHLITATYDANAQNAEQVTAGTEDALEAQNWKTRSQIKFA